VKVDAIIVGAGFAGIYMLHRLKEKGLSVKLIEMGKDVGGVWYWNRYPGVRCDVESLEYQFDFSEELRREWRWPERYSRGQVIQRYLSFVTDRLNLRSSIAFETRVEAAAYDDETKRWTVKTDKGGSFDTQFLILATGPLTTPSVPKFAGMDEFKGHIYHTARWPEHTVDFSGRNVAVIGTGSSGIQAIPVIAQEAKTLTVFQRTPHYSMPVTNRVLSDEEIAQSLDSYEEDRKIRRAVPGGMKMPLPQKGVFDVTPEERESEFQRRWTMGGFPFLTAFNDVMMNPEANEEAAKFVRKRIRDKVKDPKIANILIPTDYPLGTKRPVLDTNYYETFNEPHVKLVDARANPIECFNAQGIVAGGKTYPVDDIVLATGFDAVTGAVLNIDITGRDSLRLRDVWTAGPANFLGIGIAGFPNLFLVDGPCSPSALSNVPIAVQQQGDWIVDCIAYLHENDIAAIDADEEAQDEWVKHVAELANRTLYPRANSWYLGANIPGKPRVFMLYTGGLIRYRERCDAVAAAGYAGFRLESIKEPVKELN